VLSDVSLNRFQLTKTVKKDASHGLCFFDDEKPRADPREDRPVGLQGWAVFLWQSFECARTYLATATRA
jgi:hypothetical protein